MAKTKTDEKQPWLREEYIYASTPLVSGDVGEVRMFESSIGHPIPRLLTSLPLVASLPAHMNKSSEATTNIREGSKLGMSWGDGLILGFMAALNGVAIRQEWRVKQALAAVLFVGGDRVWSLPVHMGMNEEGQAREFFRTQPIKIKRIDNIYVDVIARSPLEILGKDPLLLTCIFHVGLREE